MAQSIDITLPNGLTYVQPTGLFIDNEFVVGQGDVFDVLNPSYVCWAYSLAQFTYLSFLSVPRSRSSP